MKIEYFLYVSGVCWTKDSFVTGDTLTVSHEKPLGIRPTCKVDKDLQFGLKFHFCYVNGIKSSLARSLLANLITTPSWLDEPIKIYFYT